MTMENIIKTRCYKWCFVPQCTNTTISTPDKIFVTVPRDKSKRKLWFTSARRDVANMSNSDLYCCQDHFELENDLENFMYHKYMNVKIRIKAGVVPHIFDCQRDRKRAFSSTLRSAVEKRSRKQLVEEAIASSSENKLNQIQATTVGTNTFEESTSTSLSPEPVIKSEEDASKTFSNKAVHMKPSHRSKYVSCNITPKMVTAATSPIKCLQLSETTEPPLQVFTVDEKATSSSSHKTSEDETFDSSTSYEPSETNSNSTSDMSEDSDNETKQDIFNLGRHNMTVELCKEKPKQYLGIPKDYFWLIDLLQIKSQSKLSHSNILFTLMKIKCNDTFDRLGDQFGMSSSNGSRVFGKTIPKLAHLLKPFIYWPKGTIKKILPIPFRPAYSHVEAIIDCFEIEIEKPTNPLTQALTWSDYKKCNTLKYLISCTPDGFINFISTGYGGRTADILLFEHCGFLDKIPHGCGVLAHRGFRHIKQILKNKNCELIKPPSVSSSAKPSKEEVLETKRIASLCIHIERVIRRVREFGSLKPHAVINHSMLAYADDLVLIACALVNIQSPIIKTGL